MATLTASSNRKFNVVIGVFSKSQERNAIQLTLPAIVVKDGERVIISDTATENFVVAEKIEHGHIVPVTREVIDGTTCEVSLLGLDDTRALVDLHVLFRSSRQESSEPKGRVLVNTFERRVIEQVKLGTKLVFEDDEVIVEAAATLVSEDWTSRSPGSWGAARRGTWRPTTARSAAAGS